MHRIIPYLFFLIVSSITTIYSQNILTGRVCDSKTKDLVPNANIFLDATSVHTITDEKGEFKILLKDIINTSLIITHVRYNAISITNPFEEIPDIIWLDEKINALTPVETVAPYFTREQKLKMFRNEFLGKTQAAKACKILNEEDIELIYDMENKRLEAFSNNPIIILNNYLGYEIHLYLSLFCAQYKYDSLFEETEEGKKRTTLNNAVQTAIIGTTTFIDLNPKNRSIKNAGWIHTGNYLPIS